MPYDQFHFAVLLDCSRFVFVINLQRVYAKAKLWCWTRVNVKSYKPKFHLARHVTSRQYTTRHVRCVEPMHFGCVELVEQHGSTCSSRRARHVERVESRRDVTWRDKWNLGLKAYRIGFYVLLLPFVNVHRTGYHVSCPLKVRQTLDTV